LGGEDFGFFLKKMGGELGIFVSKKKEKKKEKERERDKTKKNLVYVVIFFLSLPFQPSLVMFLAQV